MKCALLDTNFLMVPGKFKVDVFAELERLGYKPIVLSCVVREITKLASGKGRAGEQARVALQILAARKPQETDAGEPADDSLLRKAKELACAIATNDAALIARARKDGVPILRLRQKKYVAEM
jgi:rRNA-processing protein FCF1